MNKLREEIIENLLKALEDGDIPWRRGWSSAGRRPYNITAGWSKISGKYAFPEDQKPVCFFSF